MPGTEQIHYFHFFGIGEARPQIHLATEILAGLERQVSAKLVEHPLPVVVVQLVKRFRSPGGSLLVHHHAQARVALEGARPHEQPEWAVGIPGDLGEEDAQRAGEVAVVGGPARVGVNGQALISAGRPHRLIAGVVVQRVVTGAAAQQHAPE